ncbi:response regulator [Desulfovibrio sp. OttesenSCG-928-M16]|nr:response regulator [Desulfovibrio sp. OttesenSCG-928-M16]
MLSVLIVEDDPMVAEINKNYLEMTEGFHLAGIVPDGVQALRFLQGASVSLVLLDVFMPHMDGLSLLQEIRERHPAVDVIMVTAARTGADIQKALRLGVMDYIVKPFTLARFQASLFAYQDRLRILREADQLDQDQLDSGIFKTPQITPALPKGVDSATLQLVREVIQNHKTGFSVKDLVPEAGISRVSLKKYLEYLENTGEISSGLVYMPVGRPVTIYRLVPETEAE